MQIDYKQIYKMAAEATGHEEQLYKDLGNFVFSQLYMNIRRPPKLILRLRGVGQWHLRKQRMETILEMFPLDETAPTLEQYSKYTLFKYENKKEIHEIFKQRLKEYESYLADRDVVRQKRYATQTLLVPVNREDERFRSS